MTTVLTVQVKSLRSTVALAAINTLADLFVHFKKAMDPDVDNTCKALLLKLKLTKMKSVFINEQVNEALSAMVQHCSHGRVLNSLLKNGMRYARKQSLIHAAVEPELDDRNSCFIVLISFHASLPLFSHSCNMVRASTALHLHQLADSMEQEQIFTAPKVFRERFVTAICKASLDAAPEVR